MIFVKTILTTIVHVLKDTCENCQPFWTLNCCLTIIYTSWYQCFLFDENLFSEPNFEPKNRKNHWKPNLMNTEGQSIRTLIKFLSWRLPIFDFFHFLFFSKIDINWYKWLSNNNCESKMVTIFTSIFQNMCDCSTKMVFKRIMPFSYWGSKLFKRIFVVYMRACMRACVYEENIL